MLNAATPLASSPLAAMGLPGSAAPDGDAAADFALALDQATSEAKPEDAAAPDLLHSLADSTVQPPLAEVRPAAAPREAGAHKVDVAQSRVEARADTSRVNTVATPDELLAAPQVPANESASEPQPEPDEPPAAELLAWVASLPLPPPAPAGAPAGAQAADPATARPKVVPAPAQREALAAADTLPVAATTPAVAASVEAAAHKHGAPALPAMPLAVAALKADPASPRSAAPAATDGSSPRVDGGAWLQALAAQREGIGTPARPATDNALTMPALPGHPSSPLSRAPDAGTPLQAEVRAELGSKEFAPALGSQLSLLVRNGIEHAQLKLNPAEMGPIEVRICIDGSQAQVDFSAAQAHTRLALQEAVPALATALRESGLTLTGGGVFEQGRDPRGEARPEPSPLGAGRGDADPDTPTGAATAARGPRSRGVVDLYA